MDELMKEYNLPYHGIFSEDYIVSDFNEVVFSNEYCIDIRVSSDLGSQQFVPNMMENKYKQTESVERVRRISEKGLGCKCIERITYQSWMNEVRRKWMIISLLHKSTIALISHHRIKYQDHILCSPLLYIYIN